MPSFRLFIDPFKVMKYATEQPSSDLENGRVSIGGLHVQKKG